MKRDLIFEAVEYLLENGPIDPEMRICYNGATYIENLSGIDLESKRDLWVKFYYFVADCSIHWDKFSKLKWRTPWEGEQLELRKEFLQFLYDYRNDHPEFREY